MRRDLLVFFVAISVTPSTTARAETELTDLRMGYSFMRITDVIEGGVRNKPVFMRHNLEVGVGVGPLSLGLVFQHATKSAETKAGTPESGLMLTVGYDHIFSEWLRGQALARVAVSPGTDGSQPLYATDTDLTSKLILFDAEGWGPIDHPIFPTAFFGTTVNRFGRLQITGGAGVWWVGFSAFVSALYSLNGIENPRAEGIDITSRYAALKNAGVTTSIAYDLDVSASSQLHFEARRNFGLANAGNDLVGVVQWRFYFGEDI